MQSDSAEPTDGVDWEAVIHAYREIVVGAILKHYSPDLGVEDAKDCASDATVQIYKRRDSYDRAKGASPETWFCLLAFRRASALRRKTSRRTPDREAERGDEFTSDEIEAARKLLRDLADLAPEQLDLLMRLFVHGKKPAEIAKEDGCSKRTVEMKRKKILDSLRAKFKGN